MIINPTLEPHYVDDFIFNFDSGETKTITIDKELGDEVDLQTSPMMVMFHIAPRPSLADPETKTAAETISVFLGHVLYLTRRSRTVIPATPEQREEFRSVLHRLHPTVQ